MSEQPPFKRRPGTTAGDYRGGIVSPETLVARCWVDPECGCWAWRMAFCQGSPRIHVRIDGRKIAMRGRSAAWFVGTGSRVPAGLVAYATDDCERDDCVNPAHVRIGTKVEWGRWLSDSGKVKMLPTKIAAAREASKNKSKLTHEQVLEIRRSTRSRAELAAEHGIAQTTVSAIRHQRLHPERKEIIGASVFTWRP